jgi:hypothetical protein
VSPPFAPAACWCARTIVLSRMRYSKSGSSASADPMTLSAQIDKLKQRFKLQRVVMVGDRGMLTDARIRETLRPAGLDWITALRAPAIKALAADNGPLQLSLFDDRDMAEITSPDYPGERLVVCRNPLLAAERARKRDELLAATEADLARIRSRVLRTRNPLRGAAAIGQALGVAFGQRKMAKHFDTTITDDAFSFARNPAWARRAALLAGGQSQGFVGSASQGRHQTNRPRRR